MTDIVELLRYNANAGIPDFTNSKLLDEAAAEIERLRIQLTRAKEIINQIPDSIVGDIRASLRCVCPVCGNVETCDVPRCPYIWPNRVVAQPPAARKALAGEQPGKQSLMDIDNDRAH